MKLLMVTPEPLEGFGGLGYALSSLKRAIEEHLEWNVDILSPDGVIYGSPDFWQSLYLLQEILERKYYKYDIVHLHQFRIPQSFDYLYTSHGASLLHDEFDTVMRAVRVATVSYGYKVFLEEKYPRRFSVVHNTTYIYEQRPKEEKEIVKKEVYGTEEPVVLFYGRFAEQKGMDILPQVARLMPEVKFVFVLRVHQGNFVPYVKEGENEARSDWDRWKETFKVDELKNVEIKFNLERQDLIRHVYGADVVLMPSKWEPFGLVALESMALGTPVVASNVDGLKDQLSDGKGGILVDGFEPENFVKAIWYVLDNLNGKFTPEKVFKGYEKFRPEVIVREYEQFVYEVGVV